MKIKIKRLRYRIISLDIATKIDFLHRQLSERAQSKSILDFKRILSQKNMYVVGAFINTVLVGMGSIHFHETTMEKKGFIENVVVDKEERGKGIGDELTEALINRARKGKADYIDLTSKSERVGAIEMYKKHGFKERDTNCLRLIL